MSHHGWKRERIVTLGVARRPVVNNRAQPALVKRPRKRPPKAANAPGLVVGSLKTGTGSHRESLEVRGGKLNAVSRTRLHNRAADSGPAGTGRRAAEEEKGDEEEPAGGKSRRGARSGWLGRRFWGVAVREARRRCRKVRTKKERTPRFLVRISPG